jgi:hypothetical protein
MLAIIIFMLLLANSPAYSVPIDSADADYCLDLNSEQPMIIFERKNNNLNSIMLNIQEPLICKYYRSDTSADFKFTISKITCNDFFILAKLTGTEEQEMVKLSQTIQVDFPKSETISYVEKRRKKEELLLLKNQIIDANVKISIRCLPDLDTIFNIPFRAHITGECK